MATAIMHVTTTIDQTAPVPLCADEDPHVEWAAAIVRLSDLAHDLGDEEVTNALAPRILALQELIATTPARTAIGFAEQIWLALDDVGSGLPISENAEASVSLAFNTLYERGAALV